MNHISTLNECSVCLETYVSWVDYHEHLALAHVIKPIVAEIIANTPKPIEKKIWNGPMDKTEKRCIVVKGEQRLGLHFFIGIGE